MSLMFKFNRCLSNEGRRGILLGLLTVGLSLGFTNCTGVKKVDRSDSNSQNPSQEAHSATPAKASLYSTAPPVIAQGRTLFLSNCTGCHSFLQRGIGPNLSGVTSQRPPDWLANFIHNAPEVVNSGDERAAQLMHEYKQVMPPFTNLSKSDIQAILAYIHTNQPTPAATSEDMTTVVKDPIPGKIPLSGFTLLLEEVTQAPATATKVPLARINKMLVLPGKKDRVFIQDLRGILYELENNQLRTVMEMAKELPNFIPAPGLGTGFGSYAFHPDFYKNGLFYTTHTEKAHTSKADFAYPDSIPVALQWVLTEWKWKDARAKVFSGNGRELLRIDMISNIHGVQEITFNPLAKPGSQDYGLLYISMGDGGATENGYAFLCQSPAQIWSSVIRINPQGNNSRNGQYGIPAINPFANKEAAQALGEIFAKGFRNPNRICWTPDGKMLIADIGLTNIEELNIGKAGANYGWPAREGTFSLNYLGNVDLVHALPANDSVSHYTYPVAQYDHDEGNAISGGFVFNDPKVPLLLGKYLFGDIVNGRVFFVENSQLHLGQQAQVQEMTLQFGGKLATFQKITGSRKTDLRFGIGLKNTFYLYTKTDGRIWKVSEASR
jgi:mono/diheme cytochrome c family protein